MSLPTRARPAPASGWCRRTTIRDFDPDRFREVVRGGPFEHQLLEPGTLGADLEHWEADGVVVDRGRYGFGVFVRGMFSPGRVTIGTARCPHGRVWINGSFVGPGDIQIYPEGEDLGYRADAGASWTVIQLDRSRLHHAAAERRGRPIVLPARLMRNDHAPPAAVQRLRNVLDSLMTTSLGAAGPGSTEDADSPAETLVATILDCLDQDPRQVQVANLRRRAILYAAQSWMVENIEAGYDSRAVCEAAGITERTLQLAFREAVGMSPSRWFLCARLNRARRLLLSPGPARITVTGAAVRSGFRHLGRFSTEYSALFGERPSETLARRRRRGRAKQP